MKAFTVYQPYAFAITAGLKTYETRPRRTTIRGRVAIHAAKTDIWKERLITMEEVHILSKILSEYQSEQTKGAVRVPPHLVFGAVIGTVEIVDCVRVEEIRDSLTERERALGDYSPGRFAWVLQNPEMFDTPIPARGNQGWWTWNGERCRECWCMTCDAFRTEACLEGKDVCGKCAPDKHTSYCPWHPCENGGKA